MKSNQRSTDFTSADFLAERVPAQKVFESYAQKPVHHRGNTVVTNEQQFGQIVGVLLAPSDSLASILSTLGPTLHALTQGGHPKVDFQQPVHIPDDHPPISFARIIKGQKILGFPEETRHFEHDAPNESPSAFSLSHVFQNLPKTIM